MATKKKTETKPKASKAKAKIVEEKPKNVFEYLQQQKQK